MAGEIRLVPEGPSGASPSRRQSAEVTRGEGRAVGPASLPKPRTGWTVAAYPFLYKEGINAYLDKMLFFGKQYFCCSVKDHLRAPAARRRVACHFQLSALRPSGTRPPRVSRGSPRSPRPPPAQTSGVIPSPPLLSGVTSRSDLRLKTQTKSETRGTYQPSAFPLCSFPALASFLNNRWEGLACLDFLPLTHLNPP